MSLTAQVDTSKATASLQCVLCKKECLPTEVYMGQHDAQGKPAFACNSHLFNTSRFITGWTLFNIEQKLQPAKAAK